MVADPAYVAEWFGHARRDLQAARVLVEADDVDPIIAVAQLQQAIEKALKGFLLSHGWQLVRTHDLGFLLDEATTFEPELAEHHGVCDIATKAYREERYPGAGGIELTQARARSLYEEGRRLVDRILEAGT